MALITRVADKAEVFGSFVAAMGCASCFPALASLGAAFHHHPDPAVCGASLAG